MGRDEPVSPERKHPGADPEQAAVLADALPDQPGAADLGNGGQHEQHNGAGDGHDRTPTGRGAGAW
jgi:hypothetical protein